MRAQSEFIFEMSREILNTTFTWRLYFLNALCMQILCVYEVRKKYRPVEAAVAYAIVKSLTSSDSEHEYSGPQRFLSHFSQGLNKSLRRKKHTQRQPMLLHEANDQAYQHFKLNANFCCAE